MFKNNMRYIFSLFTLILLAGCSAKPFIIDHPEEFTGSGSNSVFIVSHGWHTGFVMPSSGIQEEIPQLKERFGSTPFIEFGWGDKGFYQAKEITVGLTLQAIFWPTESVMHVVAVPLRADQYFPGSEVEVLCLNEKELASLIAFISSSFARDNEGSVIPLKNGLYGDSQFYKGVGDYYLMNT